MKFHKYVIVWASILYVMNYAITVDEVQTLNVDNFFTQWSRFLDDVLQVKEEPISEENETIYQSFIKQGKTLDIAAVTGNKKALREMQEQMKLIKKRIIDEKNFWEEWKQFGDSLLNTKEYPLSPESEEAYQKFLTRAKELHIVQSQIDEMQQKMSAIIEKLVEESLKRDPERQISRIDELEKKVNEISEKVTEKGETHEQQL